MGLGRSNCSGTGREVPVEGCNGALLQKIQTTQIQIIDIANSFIPKFFTLYLELGCFATCAALTVYQWNIPGQCGTEDNLVLVPSKFLRLVYAPYHRYETYLYPHKDSYHHKSHL